MKYKPKTLKHIIIIVIVVFAAVVLMDNFGLGTSRSGTRVGYVSNNGWRDWTARYTLLDGTLKHTVRPKIVPSIYHIEVVTEAGEISIKLLDKNGDEIFSETNIGTELFEIEVTGKFIVQVTADKHKGAFSITN